jgi:hypothetical protein
MLSVRAPAGRWVGSVVVDIFGSGTCGLRATAEALKIIT